MELLDMVCENVLTSETVRANVALEWPVLGVDLDVLLEGPLVDAGEHGRALLASLACEHIVLVGQLEQLFDFLLHDFLIFFAQRFFCVRNFLGSQIQQFCFVNILFLNNVHFPLVSSPEFLSKLFLPHQNLSILSEQGLVLF